MKKKLIKIANQIMALETKLQAGENMTENIEKMEQLTTPLSEEELYEITVYLESKLGAFKFDK